MAGAKPKSKAPKPKHRAGPAAREAAAFPAASWLGFVLAIVASAAYMWWRRADALPAASPAGDTGPSLEEVARRFALATGEPGAARVTRGIASPASFLLRDLLAADEVEALMQVLRDGWGRHEPRSKFSATVTLDKLPALNASAAVQALNAKLATLAGLPETHLEEGYYSVYNAGFNMDAMHLDNHHSLMVPRRSVSFVVYLQGEEQGLVGGRTVFPLAELDGVDAATAAAVAAASRKINRTGVYSPGDKPQEGRVCARADGSRLCRAAYARSEQLCAAETAPERLAVRARAGDAVMFFHHDARGAEAFGALHGSCPIREGTKVVLAKFLRTGPKPYFDEARFTEALRYNKEQAEQRQQQQQQR